MYLSEELEIALEGRGYPIGTKRERSDGVYIKTRLGWKRFTKARKKAAEEKRQMSASVQGLKDIMPKLDSPLSLGGHIAKAKELQKGHEKGFDQLMGKLQELAPGAKVKGRVKKLESVIGKIVRKEGAYKDAGDLQDITGARVIHDTTEQVLATVARLKKEYAGNVLNDDDKINMPNKDGYRSYHLIVRDKDGLEKEIQIRTKSQDKMGDWHHDIYKPVNEAQEKVLAKSKTELNEYAKKLWDWYEKQDRGQDPGPEPDCPESAKLFGCGPDDPKG